MATDEELAAVDHKARLAGLGCFSFFVGGASMAMVGALLSLAVQRITRGPACQDIPACDWYIYAMWGAVIGAVTLPILVLNRVRQSAKDRDAARRNS
jgi:hypothetical protein